MKKLSTAITLLIINILLFTHCQREEFTPKKDVESNVSGINIHLRSEANATSSIHLLFFKTPEIEADNDSNFILKKDTTLNLSQVESNPTHVSLPMGHYRVVAIRGKQSLNSVKIDSSRLSHLATQLEANNLSFDEAPEWFWGINDIHIGNQSTATITMKRAVGKIILNYLHANPNLTEVTLQANGIAQNISFGGKYSEEGNVSKILTHNESILLDSVLLFPMQNTPVTLSLKVEDNTQTQTYSISLDSLVRPNQIIRVTINGGVETSTNITSEEWGKDSMLVLLDEAPDSDISTDINDYETTPNDTFQLRQIYLSVSINGGIPENYTSNFHFTLEHINGNTKVYDIPMEIVDGKLKSITPITLDRAQYYIHSYSLQDAEGKLPDPKGKSTSQLVPINLDKQTIALKLDGRQDVENAYLRQFCDSLHSNTIENGSIWPGKVVYDSDPIPSTFPSASSSITNSLWYVNVDNFVQIIPIRGEWRVHSICYRGFTEQLDGILSDYFCHLTHLTSFNIRNNLITGELPSNMNQLTKLREFAVGKNKLSGNIDALASNELAYVLLNDNQFTGEITTGLSASMPSLVYIAVNDNQFTGPISSIKSDVDYLFCQNNQFSGSIQSFDIGSAIAQYDLRGNRFNCYSKQFSSATAAARINPQKTSTGGDKNISKCN